ncbi:MarR family winged helix-turn-helix transcriptional regulator [Ferrovibrio terrae]|uniref:MarR family winged helix-turn-helix transcriptional regulator n=1 Tax=Ferrovibrio terrae TaxID=2594003 RepID=UPI0031381B19
MAKPLRESRDPATRGGFASTYLAYLLARASHIVSEEFHLALKNWKLSVPFWRVLASLSDANGMSVSDLAAMTIMKQPRITKILDRMEADGLVARRADRHDRRRVFIDLTDKGRRRVAPALAAAKAHEASILGPLSESERATIKRALDLLIHYREDVAPKAAKAPRRGKAAPKVKA